jgi:hypothetical protein
MAKQTFTTGQVLTAAQMTSLQQTAMLGGAASAKTASYTLVAADAGTAISMSNASPTTITVNTALFAAGDTVQITNIGAGVCTITAGTATVNTAASLALAQYESGTLDFTSTSAAIFIKGAGAAAGGGGKVLQVVNATTTTQKSSTSATYADTNLTATITPTLATSKILVMVSQSYYHVYNGSGEIQAFLNILRGATQLTQQRIELRATAYNSYLQWSGTWTDTYLDSPATTSATTYKTQVKNSGGLGTIYINDTNEVGSITLLEIGV